MSDTAITVLIVDDHEIVRKGIRSLLETEEGIEVVGEAANGEEGIAAAAELSPRVILMDLMMPRLDGVEAIRRIRSRQPKSRILVLTSFGSDDKLFPAVKAGAIGYLLKEAGADELVKAIRQAARGESALNPSVARRLLREFSHEHAVLPPTDPLTDREIEIIRELALGFSNAKIAGRLYISEATVRTHVSNILSKLHLENRTQAALYAFKERIATIDDLGDLPEY